MVGAISGLRPACSITAAPAVEESYHRRSGCSCPYWDSGQALPALPLRKIIKSLARSADARIFNHRWTQINTDGFDSFDRLRARGLLF